ncbi:MAG: hypothetical protein JWR07_1879 [Nevskia sp.]|nr:hypothetical protein [Nevskia sp.]
MPKLTKYPRLRSHVRKGKDGRIYVYWFYDMRPEGKKDVPLGTDRDEAIAQWEELHLKKPRIRGRLREAIQVWVADVLPTYENEETKRNYLRHITRVDNVLGMEPWSAITMVMIKKYLTNRKNVKDKTKKAETQANREMAVLQVVWNWARQNAAPGRETAYTTLPWPAAGMERSKWKNKEYAREFEVTDDIFDAVYAEAEPMLRDCMDLSTATGMRLTDCRTILLPADNILHLKAGKTGKKADFDLSLSQVLPDLLKRRRALDTNHLMLLSTVEGFPVEAKDLRREYDKARKKAAAKAREAGDKALALEIESMVLRDMRKRAADLSEDDAGASALLQHSSVALTRKHYRSKATKLRPVR